MKIILMVLISKKFFFRFNHHFYSLDNRRKYSQCIILSQNHNLDRANIFAINIFKKYYLVNLSYHKIKCLCSPSTESCGMRWLAVAKKIMLPQNIKVPSIPFGKNIIDIVPPMNNTNISIGVRKPQIGHNAKIMLK